jgi:hypothetical protein
MTDGANNGVVNDVAVISYTDRNTPFAGICNDIQINNPTVNGTTFGRGISVGRGENIVYRNVRVSRLGARAFT